ncbi:geopeptide radical SAM maturase [Geomonas sp. Red32]|uniref:geopeptide radical SAM maturase n=1 Tax=Geomonas sp. Red32 TaxID=2912856 RepID=UPI00202CD3A3|nr:geopeptide radical SAM maturase [Geomonas sp. Red32]MCM0081705.1 geopeptide radical SAM maturase [Geomonas sp. Red32]
MHLSRYLKIYPSNEKPGYFLLFSTLRSSTALVSGATLSTALTGSKMGIEGETLRKLGMLVEHPSIEREQVRTLIERANAQNRKYRAVVVLNLACNLDCSYCYEGGFRNEQYMSRDTAQLLVETLKRDQIALGLDVNLVFYGGEALLSEDLIRFISAPLQEAAEAQGVTYNFDLVTNGTLLNRATVERLLPFGLKGAKFTLDGPREIHDRQRPFASGAGSFDCIVDNLREVYDHIQVMLGGNCREENYREFPRLLDYLLEIGIRPEKLLRVLFTPVTPKAGCTEHGSECASSSEPWLIEALPFLREETLARGFAAPKLKVSACMLEFDHNVVVNYDGALYKCPAFMGYDGFSVGTLAEGLSDFKESHGIGNWQNEECLDCPYLPICFGGCRFLNLLKDRPASALDCRREFYDGALERMILMSIPHPPCKQAPPPMITHAVDYCI